MMPDFAIFEQPARELERSGYAVVHDFLNATAISQLAQECLVLHASGRMQTAAIGHGAGRGHRPAIRGDRTAWFDQRQLTAVQSAYWTRIDDLRTVFNRTLLLGLEAYEAHYALYPPGSHYARHRDRFRDDDTRVLSTVLYLNAQWRSEDGGALRLYLDANRQIPSVDIYPQAGTLVLFLSADFEHEVLPARRQRLSIAGWLRRRGIHAADSMI